MRLPVLHRLARRSSVWLGLGGAVVGTSLLTIGVAFSPLSSRSAPVVVQPTILPFATVTTLSRSLAAIGQVRPAGSNVLSAGQPISYPLCPADTALANTQLRPPSPWAIAARWLADPQQRLDTAWHYASPQLYARLAAAPWPTIQPRARRARVPVIMYHDVLPEKQVFFDLTPDELAADFQQIKDQGLTPISLEQLISHLQTGLPLPAKPILLTFDDGYIGHYTEVYPLLKEYGYPAVFSVFTDKVDGKIVGRSTVTWAQLQEMAADPLVTIAAHSVTHPPDLREFDAATLTLEVAESKRRLEAQLGEPIRYFTYPEGKHDKRVMKAVAAAGYEAAIAMDDNNEGFAGESENLLAIARFGQSSLEDVLDQAWGGAPAPAWGTAFNFSRDIQLETMVVDEVSLMLASGGRPITLHANSRYQVKDIIAGTGALAAVDGGFFSMRYLDSNVMIGPSLSQVTGQFDLGNASENPRLNGRPLVLISPDQVRFVPFVADRHNTLAALQAELPAVTDAFVAAAWLVREGQAQDPASFGDLFDFDAERHRAFWGIRDTGEPVVGASSDRVGSVGLGQRLAALGLRDAVMLDSGASASVVYAGESLMDYEPRPVPHAVALVPAGWSGLECHAAMYDEESAIYPRAEEAAP